MEHLRILKRALHITHKYRTLWLIGLLLVIVGGGIMSGNGAGSGSGAGSGERNWTDEDYQGWPPEWEDETFDNWDDFTRSPQWKVAKPFVIGGIVIFSTFMILGLLFGIVGLVVRYVTRTSLIEMVDLYEETEQELGFWDALRRGWSRSAFRLFLINFLLGLPALLAVLLLIAIVGLIATTAIGESFASMAALIVLFLAVLFPVIVLGIVYGIVVTPIKELAHRISVLDNKGAWDSIRKSCGLIWRNFGSIALQYLILIGLGIAWTIIVIFVNLVLVLIVLVVGGLPGLLLSGIIAATLGSPLFLLLSLLILVPIAIIVLVLPNMALNVFATVYHSTVWTLTFRELCVLDEKEEWAEKEIEVRKEAE